MSSRARLVVGDACEPATAVASFSRRCLGRLRGASVAAREVGASAPTWGPREAGPEARLAAPISLRSVGLASLWRPRGRLPTKATAGARPGFAGAASPLLCPLRVHKSGLAAPATQSRASRSSCCARSPLGRFRSRRGLGHSGISATRPGPLRVPADLRSPSAGRRCSAPAGLGSVRAACRRACARRGCAPHRRPARWGGPGSPCCGRFAPAASVRLVGGSPRSSRPLARPRRGPRQHPSRQPSGLSCRPLAPGLARPRSGARRGLAWTARPPRPAPVMRPLGRALRALARLPNGTPARRLASIPTHTDSSFDEYLTRMDSRVGPGV